VELKNFQIKEIQNQSRHRTRPYIGLSKLTEAFHLLKRTGLLSPRRAMGLRPKTGYPNPGSRPARSAKKARGGKKKIGFLFSFSCAGEESLRIAAAAVASPSSSYFLSLSLLHSLRSVKPPEDRRRTARAARAAADRPRTRRRAGEEPPRFVRIPSLGERSHGKPRSRLVPCFPGRARARSSLSAWRRRRLKAPGGSAAAGGGWPGLAAGDR